MSNSYPQLIPYTSLDNLKTFCYTKVIDQKTAPLNRNKWTLNNICLSPIEPIINQAKVYFCLNNNIMTKTNYATLSAYKRQLTAVRQERQNKQSINIVSFTLSFLLTAIVLLSIIN